MNETIKLISGHRSIRNYQDKEIPEYLLNQILKSATEASSSGNMQAYSIIVTKDKMMKEKMIQAHFNQGVYQNAPVFITFCADFHRKREWLKLNQAANNFDNFMSFMIASIDAILASQNAALVAESLGLGICYLGTTLASSNEIGRVLELPENVIPIVGFTLGYPNETPEKRKRLPLKAIIHHEKYRPYTPDDIRSIYAEKEKEGLKRYQSDEVLMSFLKEKGIENLAQIYTQYKYTEESHLSYSRNLMNYLKVQRFL